MYEKTLFFSAIQHYKEALTFHSEDDIALCALARLYLMTDDLDQCQYTCMTLLRKDKENEEGMYLLDNAPNYIVGCVIEKRNIHTKMVYFYQLFVWLYELRLFLLIMKLFFSATVMMADLAFRKNDYESAMVHFQQLLENRPDYWVALARLVEVMRRTGNLEKIPEYLTKSEEFVGTRASLEPGLNFCKGAI